MSALMLQKGAIEVERNIPDHPLQVQETPNMVVKLTLFKEECTRPWEHVHPAPVKAILDILPQLVTCHESQCQCPKSHVDKPEDSDVIMDDRDFVTFQFKRTSPASADLFACCFRVRSKVVESLIKASGHQGRYVEIRAQNGGRDDEGFHTIWLPKKSLREAGAEQSAIAEQSALVRVGHIRARQSLDFGTCLQQVIEEWGWKAKALRTTGKSQDQSGLLWQVLSTGCPPSTVFALSHGDVLLTRNDDPKSEPTKTSPVIEASKKTRSILEHAKVDALQIHDPWAKAVPAPGSPDHRFVTQAHLDAAAQSIEARVAAKLPSESEDINMDTGLATRVDQLEASAGSAVH